jgi:hypothetical protein
MSFELIEDYTFDELKETLESDIIGWLAGEHMEAARDSLSKCTSHTEVAHWYQDYEPLYWSRHNHDIEDFRYEELGDRMASCRLVDFEDMGARDFWKYYSVVAGFRYAQFYRECDMLLAKHKFNLDDDDIDIMRI